MPKTAEDVETFLDQLDRTFERDENTFFVSSGSGAPPIAIFVTDPIVVVRVDIGKVPDGDKRQNAVFRQLLEYNATELVHCAYALEEGNEIVLSSGLELENLDINELAAVLSDIDIALARHVKPLRDLTLESVPDA